MVQLIIVNISFPLPLKRFPCLVQFCETRRIVPFGFAPEFQISTYLLLLGLTGQKMLKSLSKITTLFLVLHFGNCPYLEHTS